MGGGGIISTLNAQCVYMLTTVKSLYFMEPYFRKFHYSNEKQKNIKCQQR